VANYCFLTANIGDNDKMSFYKKDPIPIDTEAKEKIQFPLSLTYPTSNQPH